MGRNFASAEARRGTEPVWQLSDRPLHPFGEKRKYLLEMAFCRMFAAALSAAVNSRNCNGGLQIGRAHV